MPLGFLTLFLAPLLAVLNRPLRRPHSPVVPAGSLPQPARDTIRDARSGGPSPRREPNSTQQCQRTPFMVSRFGVPGEPSRTTSRRFQRACPEPVEWGTQRPPAAPALPAIPTSPASRAHSPRLHLAPQKIRPNCLSPARPPLGGGLARDSSPLHPHQFPSPPPHRRRSLSLALQGERTKGLPWMGWAGGGLVGDA